MFQQLMPGESLEDALSHLVRRLDIEGQTCDDARRTESDDDPVEVTIAPCNSHDLTLGSDELNARDRRRQAAIGGTRPVRARRDSAGDADVWQRGQIPERQTMPGERGCQLAVAEVRPEGDCLSSPTTTLAGIRSRLTNSAASAIAEKVCREPIARRLLVEATICRNPSSDRGRWITLAR